MFGPTFKMGKFIDETAKSIKDVTTMMKSSTDQESLK